MHLYRTFDYLGFMYSMIKLNTKRRSVRYQQTIPITLGRTSWSATDAINIHLRQVLNDESQINMLQ